MPCVRGAQRISKAFSEVVGDDETPFVTIRAEVIHGFGRGSKVERENLNLNPI